MSRTVIVRPDDDLRRRALAHSALGEPVRLAIVESLLLSDQTPQDFVDALEIRSNLLAHHLNVLEAAGLVERTRSNGDGRRRYVRLLGELPGHICLRPQALQARSLVFACTADLGLSAIAVKLWAERSPIPARAAAHAPAQPRSSAVTAARQRGLGTLADPQGLDTLLAEEVPDILVTLHDVAREALPTEGQARSLHWSMSQPDGARAFVPIIAELTRRMDILAEALTP